MRRSFDPALVVAMLALLCASSVASEEGTQEFVELIPDSARFNSLCENLISQVLQQANVTFVKSSAEIGTSALATLDEIVEIVVDCPSLLIEVTGHTDNRGNEAANDALSKARAESVVAYLTERAIDPGRLCANGVGSDSPIASNENAAGRQVNRRIEFELSFRSDSDSKSIPCPAAPPIRSRTPGLRPVESQRPRPGPRKPFPAR